MRSHFTLLAKAALLTTACLPIAWGELQAATPVKKASVAATKSTAPAAKASPSSLSTAVKVAGVLKDAVKVVGTTPQTVPQASGLSLGGCLISLHCLTDAAKIAPHEILPAVKGEAIGVVKGGVGAVVGLAETAKGAAAIAAHPVQAAKGAATLVEHPVLTAKVVASQVGVALKAGAAGAQRLANSTDAGAIAEPFGAVIGNIAVGEVTGAALSHVKGAEKVKTALDYAVAAENLVQPVSAAAAAKQAGKPAQTQQGNQPDSPKKLASASQGVTAKPAQRQALSTRASAASPMPTAATAAPRATAATALRVSSPGVSRAAGSQPSHVVQTAASTPPGPALSLAGPSVTPAGSGEGPAPQSALAIQQAAISHASQASAPAIGRAGIPQGGGQATRRSAGFITGAGTHRVSRAGLAPSPEGTAAAAAEPYYWSRRARTGPAVQGREAAPAAGGGRWVPYDMPRSRIARAGIPSGEAATPLAPRSRIGRAGLNEASPGAPYERWTVPARNERIARRTFIPQGYQAVASPGPATQRRIGRAGVPNAVYGERAAGAPVPPARYPWNAPAGRGGGWAGRQPAVMASQTGAAPSGYVGRWPVEQRGRNQVPVRTHDQNVEPACVTRPNGDAVRCHRR